MTPEQEQKVVSLLNTLEAAGLSDLTLLGQLLAAAQKPVQARNLQYQINEKKKEQAAARLEAEQTVNALQIEIDAIQAQINALENV